jgi:hypothetical protein
MRIQTTGGGGRFETRSFAEPPPKSWAVTVYDVVWTTVDRAVPVL